jgi:rhomboid protease GluP
MAFGLSPKHVEELKTDSLTKKGALVIAVETAKNLDWEIGFLSKSGFIAYTKFSMSSWSEEVQVKIEEGKIIFKSECSGSQMVDWGKNKKNAKIFLSEFDSVKKSAVINEIDSRYVELEKRLFRKVCQVEMKNKIT